MQTPYMMEKLSILKNKIETYNTRTSHWVTQRTDKPTKAYLEEQYLHESLRVQDEICTYIQGLETIIIDYKYQLDQLRGKLNPITQEEKDAAAAELNAMTQDLLRKSKE